jgi:hypothetical protein
VQRLEQVFRSPLRAGRKSQLAAIMSGSAAGVLPGAVSPFPRRAIFLKGGRE